MAASCEGEDSTGGAPLAPAPHREGGTEVRDGDEGRGGPQRRVRRRGGDAPGGREAAGTGWGRGGAGPPPCWGGAGRHFVREGSGGRARSPRQAAPQECSGLFLRALVSVWSGSGSIWRGLGCSCAAPVQPPRRCRWTPAPSVPVRGMGSHRLSCRLRQLPSSESVPVPHTVGCYPQPPSHR